MQESPRDTETCNRKSMQPKLSQVLAIRAFAFLILAGASSGLLDGTLHNTLCANQSITDDTEELINQLNSRSFSERESASEELVKLGQDVIPALARTSVACSPETCCRIKTTLEQICTKVDEESFYKCTGILMTRFGSNDAALNSRLTQLKLKWKAQVKKRAIIALRKKGAIINDPLGNINGQGVFANANHLVVNRQLPAFTVPNAQSETRIAKPKLSKKELKAKIEKILNSDLETNRRLVFGSEKEPTQSQVSQPTIRVVQNGVIIRQLAQQQLQFPRSPGSGIELTIPKNWKVTPEDHGLLTDISPVTSLTLEEQNVDSELTKLLGTFALNKITFRDCDVKPDQLEDVEWPNSLAELIFEDQAISKELIVQCKHFPRLQQLSINRCEFDAEALEPIIDLKTVRGLRLQDAEINDAVFEILAEARNINFVSLTAVKFQTTDYLALMKKRRDIQVTYSARAFLGVRGPINAGLGSGGCQISDVIPNSGAEAAGLKVDDVIEKVNGQNVHRFEDLRLHIAAHVAGDKLNLTILRGNEKMDIKVELRDHSTAPNE